MSRTPEPTGPDLRPRTCDLPMQIEVFLPDASTRSVRQIVGRLCGSSHNSDDTHDASHMTFPTVDLRLYNPWTNSSCHDRRRPQIVRPVRQRGWVCSGSV